MVALYQYDLLPGIAMSLRAVIAARSPCLEDQKYPVKSAAHKRSGPWSSFFTRPTSTDHTSSMFVVALHRSTPDMPKMQATESAVRLQEAAVQTDTTTSSSSLRGWRRSQTCRSFSLCGASGASGSGGRTAATGGARFLWATRLPPPGSAGDAGFDSSRRLL